VINRERRQSDIGRNAGAWKQLAGASGPAHLATSRNLVQQDGGKPFSVG
jgi:hypothetical protein